MTTAATAAGKAAVREHVVLFGCCGQTLLGVLGAPATPAEHGVLIIVGGPQYRVGSHRQFVQLARALAGIGHATMRFDVRGMGDATGAMQNFERIEDDIGAAIDAFFSEYPSLRRVTLCGLCDGASAALLYLNATRDVRVRGLCLLNPWVRSVQTLAAAKLKHYYRDRLVSASFWRKFLAGGVGGKAVRDLMVNLRVGRAGADPAVAAGASFQQRMASALRDFTGPVLTVLSGRDLTAQEFEHALAHDPIWYGLKVPQVGIADADHTFSSDEAQRRLVAVVVSALSPAWCMGSLPTGDHIEGVT